MRTPQEIVELYRQRRMARGPELSKMLEILDIYDGQYVVPLPDINKVAKAAVPNLVATGIDHYGMRIGASLPNQRWPALRPGFKNSEEKARDRRKVSQGWWEHSRVDLKMPRWGREYGAYGSAVMHMRPDFAHGVPQWCWRNPLMTFPSSCEDPDDPEPEDCIMAYRRTYAWLQRRYPLLSLTRPKRSSPDDECTLIEYSDPEQVCLVAVAWHVTETDGGHRHDSALWTPSWSPSMEGYSSGKEYEVLEWAPNRIGVCPTVVAGKINLGRRKGAHDNNIGSYKAQSLIMALELDGVITGIFPNEWVVGTQPGRPPVVLAEADGRTGEYGMIQDGTIQVQQYSPSYLAPQTRDYLERVQRINAGVPPEFGGESATNVRTGRRGDSIYAATVDYQVGEAQRVFARALEATNRRAVALARNVLNGDQRKTFYVSGWKGDGWVEYTPNRLFETDQNVVQYPNAGMSVENMTIIAGQLIGTGLASSETIREMHPFIDDPENERDRITSESLERALATSIEQQAASGTIPGVFVARIAQLVKSGQMELPEAYEKVHAEAQEQQSPNVNPAAPGDPSTMPGLAVPGQGAEAGSAIPPVQPGIQDLAAQLGALYRGGGAALQRSA